MVLHVQNVEHAQLLVVPHDFRPRSLFLSIEISTCIWYMQIVHIIIICTILITL